SRRLRKRFEGGIEEPERQAYAELANLRFKAFGKSIAPDATFTLRLAYGTVKGYQVGGEVLPFHTTLGGTFAPPARLGRHWPLGGAGGAAKPVSRPAAGEGTGGQGVTAAGLVPRSKLRHNRRE